MVTLTVLGIVAVVLIGGGAGLLALARYYQLPDNRIPDEWTEDDEGTDPGED